MELWLFLNILPFLPRVSNTEAFGKRLLSSAIISPGACFPVTVAPSTSFIKNSFTSSSGSESAVRRRAEELLHLTCEQFSQVIVLPQGEFLRLLRASSSDKGEMLKTLFSAGVWRQVTDRFHQRERQLEDKARQTAALRASLLQQEEAESLGGVLGEPEYAAEVTMPVLLPEEKVKSFTQRITEITAGGVVPAVTGERLKDVPR